jgi:hypothetical protein
MEYTWMPLTKAKQKKTAMANFRNITLTILDLQ